MKSINNFQEYINIQINGKRMVSRKTFLILVVLISGVLTTKHAWVGDDAYITFRYAENTVSGYGPVFNIGERVQGYSHPLWFLMLTAGRGLGFDLFYWSVLLGLSFNLLTVYLFGNHLIRDKGFFFGFAFFAIILYSCSSFVDFQTSGLESSLNNLLIVMLLIVAIEQNLIKVSLFTGLLLFNRMDNLFIALPLLACVFMLSKEKHSSRISKSLIGLSPIFVWVLFSTTYYGFIFPNTKAAKIGAFPFSETAAQGLLFLWDFIQWEFFPSTMLFFSMIFMFVNYKKTGPVLTASAAASLCHLIYVVSIGGGFMRGRMLLPSLFVSIAGFSIWTSKKKVSNEIIIPFVILAVVSYMHAENSPAEKNAYGIVNERNFYGKENSLLSRGIHPLAEYGLELRQEYAGGLRTTVETQIGMKSYYMGSGIDVIDKHGLTDAFIARTDALPYKKQRVGHIERRVPMEYYTERITGIPVPSWEDSSKQELWEEIKTITRGDILSLERAGAILHVWKEYGF